ncbi:LysR family transcriptional regulator [Comamonas sp. 26]|uniref:LysR family transcriptional regulator n=1 Tax=Comamonas sp. 26 TaxID=2035201 RepID=UPI000C17B2A4|nr:LysR family transcriptional regulator [Comamonas sp. 26]PIG08208.1 DNA-binding transcriptional LysR family regulator [Comamonas sp. 26]
MRFDLTDLQLFVHILDSGTLTAAAQRCHLTLASASERVRGMEALLGTALLVRQARGVQPTAAGHTLGQHARQVLAQMQQLRGAMGEFGAGLAGQIRLRGNTSAVREHLPLAIGGFLLLHPQIALELQECPSAEVLGALHQGLCDIGVAAEPQDASALSGLHCEPWKADPLAAVLPQCHALAKHQQLTLTELLQENWVGLPRDSALQQLLQRQAQQISGQLLRTQVQLPHFEGLCQLVGQGVGIAVLPLAAVQRHATSTGVVAVPLSETWAQRQLLLCMPVSTAALSLPARQLYQHLLQTT